MSDSQGNFVWYDLTTNDVNGAIEFYKDVIGWGTQAWEGGEKPYVMWRAGEAPLGGVMALPDEAKKTGTPPHWLYYVKVDDLDAALARAKKGGGRVMHGPMEVPGGDRVAQCMDPQGAAFALHGK